MSEVLFSLKANVNTTTFSLGSSDSSAHLASSDKQSVQTAQSEEQKLKEDSQEEVAVIESQALPAQSDDLVKAAQDYLDTLHSLGQILGREDNDQLTELARSIVDTEKINPQQGETDLPDEG